MGQATILHALVADEHLQRLQRLAAQRRTEFDAFDFIGELRLESGASLWASEEFHSNLLAWLLRPTASHGLGDRFLGQLLDRVDLPEDAESVDWSTTDVIREWEHVVCGQLGYLDILIRNDAAQVLCAIENKTFSSEHHEQLTRYRNALRMTYPTFTRFHMFLTPRGTEPYRDEEKEHWQTLTYSTIRGILQELVNDDDHSPNSAVRAFLRQYATTLRRNLVPDTSVSHLARRIYLEHREAVELLFANRPDWAAETKPILKASIEQQSGWRLDRDTRSAVRFRADVWDQYGVTRTGSGWESDSNALILFEFLIQDGRPFLQVWMSPANKDNEGFRQRLFEAISQHPTLFSPRESSLRDSWMTLHRDEDYLLEEDDLGLGWDDDTTRAKLESWVADFADSRLPAMNKVIVDCLEDYEAAGQS
ncbi:MAG: PD-(D/E)XK nuclease family protein [Chloroflexi bacterium]|nr:PD-(D/E)XK nuclease family protein [Chloroflexota bacterium]